MFSPRIPAAQVMSVAPMIEVRNLTKRYAGRTALADVSFSVARGEIVGLLGPNGAGKSTTMRILSCYMPATSGTARVAGYDVYHDSTEVRRRIGYMPENNPLHNEMRVREYLKFRARLKGLSRAESRERIDTVLQQCSLTDVSKRIIGQLSKGLPATCRFGRRHRARAGLIILDEPTIGLDPHQIRLVRQLIKSLAGTHTVLISSHILPEIEMTCSRVMIMLMGKILASDYAGQSATVDGGQRPDHRRDRRTGSGPEGRVGPDGRGGTLRCVGDGRWLSTLRVDRARWPWTCVRRFSIAGAGARLAVAGIDAQPAFLEDIYVQVTRPKEEDEL
jgi:ABC-2 type transport system ATP-binding protein